MNGNVRASLLFLVSLCLVSSWGIHSSIFAITQRNMRGLTTAVLTTIHSTAIYCANECVKYFQCNSFALGPKQTDGSRMRSCDLLSSENISDITPSSGWNIFSIKPAFIYEVLNTAGDGASVDSTWIVDCNYNQTGFANGVLVALWETYFNDSDIDRAKCARVQFGEITLVDTTKTLVKDTVTDSDCPRDHVVTAVWDDRSDYKNMDYQKCVPLTPVWSVDISTCEQKVTGIEVGGGSKKADDTWKFQCVSSTDKFAAIVGVFRIYKQLRITCCDLLQNF
ncbi:uncharacterized protein LOC143258230 [Tachypleus tridentatus]|uniref:uncharacterized protein LOC143258230 n=1 Tax=Tachypleus tridentatus TaxID=6853 RepID=UPI003FD286CA